MMHQRFICPVGQGGFAVECVGDFTVVYDCGTKSSYQMVDACISYLARNVMRVDVLFISHFDKDHVNSIKKLLERVKVVRAVMPLIPDALKIAYGAYTKGAYTSIRTLLNEYRVEVDEVGDDARMETDGLGYLWEWIAKSMMSQNEFDKVLSYLQSEKVDVSRLSKDLYYLENQKEIINNAFH